MSEDLQSLLDKINREGVEKAQAAADQIIAEAKAKAATIVKAANEEAAKAKSDAQKCAADYTERAEETIRQSMRDAVLKIESSVTELFERTLATNVDTALANPTTVIELVTQAIKGITGPTEVAVNAKLASLLKAQLAEQKNITVITDDTLGTGFSVKIDGGRVEHAYTGEVIATELAKRLRPELAKLLK